MSRFLVVFALLFVLFQGAMSHFQLTYPQSRGFVEDNEPTDPCGGFNTVNNTRSQFPLQNAFVEIYSEHTQYTYTVNLLINNNPSVSDFSSNNVRLIAQGQRHYPESSCLPVNLSNVTGATDGTNATIQVKYTAGDGLLYQCTDVVLKSNPSGFNNSMCINATNSSPSSSPSPGQSAAVSLSATGGLLLVSMVIISTIIA